jgi:8-oxo-dGTP diphosphatase
MSFTYEYPKMDHTVDIVVLRWYNEEQQVLLIQRKDDPYKNCWALPGGFVNMDEDLDAAANRELFEETGIQTDMSTFALTQLATYGKPNRDPRGRVIATAYWGAAPQGLKAQAGDDAKAVKWVPVKSLPPLAFDHSEIIRDARVAYWNSGG